MAAGGGGDPNPPNPVSPKVTAATVAGAVATAFWTVAAATFWKDVFDATAVAALTGATTTILAAVLAFVVPDRLRNQGRSFQTLPPTIQAQATNFD